MPVEVREKLTPGLTRTWTVTKVLAHEQTAFQEVLIGETEQGVTLFCNNERESTELTQQIYHEGQTVPALCYARGREHALVIGSSEGVVTQILAADGFKKVTHIDIDEECVRLCAKHLPYGYTHSDIWDFTAPEQLTLFASAEVDLRFEDGYKFVFEQQKGTKYDLICVDLPDEHSAGVGVVNELYSVGFIEECYGLLAEDGAFITQAGCPSFWRNKELKSMWNRMSKIFPHVSMTILEEQDWAWLVGCEGQSRKAVNGLAYPSKHICDRHIDCEELLSALG